MSWNLVLVHKVCVYALVGIAFMALVTGGAVDPVTTWLWVAAAGVSWIWEPPRIDFRRFDRFWTPLSLGVVAVLAVIVFTTDLVILEGGIYLLLYLTVAKLFQRERPADYNQATALSFLLLATSTVYNEDLSFALLFALYVVLGVLSFSVYHFRIQLEEHPRASTQARRFGPRVFTAITLVAVVSFLMSVVFFFTFPRVGLGFFARGAGLSNQLSTGFSDQVELGTYGTLADDQRVVMRVEFPDGSRPADPVFYWRGISFDRYDGRGWSRTLRQVWALPPGLNRSIKVRRLPEGLTLTEGLRSGRLVRQSIYLEPNNHRVLFALPVLTQVDLPERTQSVRVQAGRLGDGDTPSTIRAFGRRQEVLLVSQTGDVTYSDMGDTGYQYTAISRTDTPEPAQLRQVTREEMTAKLEAAGLNAWVYLQLPEDFNPRIRQLAEQIVRGQTNDYDRVIAVRDYLQTNYAYTTNLPDPGNQPPIDFFLFTSRRGHCEYFATAEALLLRSLGIPARMVNGFLGGRWNSYDGYLAVRNSNAHSWVEVPFGTLGWLTVDPTPAGAIPTLGGWAAGWQDVYDALRFRWNKYVLEYSLDTQSELLREAGQLLNPRAGQDGAVAPPNLKELLSEVLRSAGRNWAVSLVVVSFTAGAGWLGRRRQTRPWSRLDWGFLAFHGGGAAAVVLLFWQPTPQVQGVILAGGLPIGIYLLGRWLTGHAGAAGPGLQRISRVYVRLRLLVQEAGVPVPDQAGPGALAQALAKSGLPEAEVAIGVVELYLGVRFGGRPLSPQELHQAELTVNHLAQCWRPVGAAKR